MSRAKSKPYISFSSLGLGAVIAQMGRAGYTPEDYWQAMVFPPGWATPPLSYRVGKGPRAQIIGASKHPAAPPLAQVLWKYHEALLSKSPMLTMLRLMDEEADYRWRKLFLYIAPVPAAARPGGVSEIDFLSICLAFMIHEIYGGSIVNDADSYFVMIGRRAYGVVNGRVAGSPEVNYLTRGQIVACLANPAKIPVSNVPPSLTRLRNMLHGQKRLIGSLTKADAVIGLMGMYAGMPWGVDKDIEDPCYLNWKLMDEEASETIAIELATARSNPIKKLKAIAAKQQVHESVSGIFGDALEILESPEVPDYLKIRSMMRTLLPAMTEYNFKGRIVKENYLAGLILTDQLKLQMRTRLLAEKEKYDIKVRKSQEKYALAVLGRAPEEAEADKLLSETDPETGDENEDGL